MLSRRKKQSNHTFLEGTSGCYVPRSIPPTIPICLSSINNLQNDRSSTSPSSPTNLQPKKPSTQSINSVTGDVPIQKKTSSSSLAPSVSSLVENNGYHINGRREPSPRQIHRKIPSGQQPLSSHSFNYERPRKMLAPSLSFSVIGNHQQQYDHNEIQDVSLISSDRRSSSTLNTINPSFQQQRFTSISLQHLPGRSNTTSTSIIEVTGNDDAVAGNIPEEQLDLPPNWSQENIVTHKEGSNEPITLRYYVDHNTKRTHWLHPLVKEKLPFGWRKEYTPQLGVVYHNDQLGTSQYEHPGLAKNAPLSTTTNQHRIDNIQSPQKIQNNNEIHTINLVRDEVPEWLHLYCRAPSSTDHLLDWTLFSVTKLEYYWGLVYQLFRQDVIDAVRKRDRLMIELQKEITRREQELINNGQ